LTDQSMVSTCVIIYGSGHLIPTGDEEAMVVDSVEAMLEQCRAQNRQLISEMRKLLILFLQGTVFVTECCKLEMFEFEKCSV